MSTFTNLSAFYLYINKTINTCIETIEESVDLIKNKLTNLISENNDNTEHIEDHTEHTVIEKYDEIGVDLEINNSIFQRSYRYF